MHITLVDDSVPFDGFTASTRALGGAEKAFASLPGALVRRGHRVSVYNRCRWAMVTEGAQWETLDNRAPLTTDVLIAFRKPALLEFVRQAGRRVLWFTGPGRMLAKPQARAMLQEHKPLVLLGSDMQTVGWSPLGAQVAMLPPALRPDYLAAPPAPEQPPRAIVTTHPAHGLDWLVDLWISRIHPAIPQAELHIHSMSLSKAVDGGQVDAGLEDLAAKVFSAQSQGVRVLRPQADGGMAAAYAEACAHLYPGHADDCTAFTLMESQARGLPAVLRPLGAAPERVADGRSAYVAPDDDAFASLTIMLLTDPSIRASLSQEARALYQNRDWDACARRIEELLT